jgi:hypothetical protein
MLPARRPRVAALPCNANPQPEPDTESEGDSKQTHYRKRSSMIHEQSKSNLPSLDNKAMMIPVHGFEYDTNEM